MDPIKFVSALQHEVGDSATRGTTALALAPPGRRVSKFERDRSVWYGSLSIQEREFVDSLIAMASHDCLFGVLAILDGSRTIDDGSGRFELWYIKDNKTLLNPVDAIGLHEILNSSQKG